MVLLMTLAGIPGFLHNFLSPICVCLSVSVFILLKSSRVPAKITSIVSAIALSSMEIYALHPCLLELLKKIWAPSGQYWLFQILIYFVTVVLLSYLMAVGLKKLPLFRKVYYNSLK